MKTLFLFTFFFSLAAVADSSSPIGRTLGSIEITGHSRTQEYVITRELEFSVGDVLTEWSLNESVTRLLNLRIFTDVRFSYEFPKDDKTVNLTITVQERWTALPILKAGSAGGTDFITLGAFDINFLGRYIEVGAQYESLNGRPAGVTWFRNPRLFGQRLLFGYDLWFVNRNRELFDEGSEPTRAYTLSKNRYHFFLQKEFVNWFVPGIGIDYIDESISQSDLDENQKSKNSARGFSPDSENQQLFFELTLRLGRLNFDNYLVEGFQSDIEVKTSQTDLASDRTEFSITAQNRFFFRFFDRHNAGLNLRLGHTDSQVLQNQFYLGGLEEVRGFADGQFIGRSFWQANVEYRLPSWRSNWIVFQHVLFYDIGNVGSSLSRAFENRETPFQAIGTGIRLISPKVFRFNLRIDVASSFGRDRDEALSIGLQQFF